MNVKVYITKNFKKEAKPLIKKFPSLKQDLIALENQLLQNPTSGILLSENTYKIHLKTKLKNKGKSGGARIISFVEKTIIIDIFETLEETTVNLITIYDKSSTDSINIKELNAIIKNSL